MSCFEALRYYLRLRFLFVPTVGLEWLAGESVKASQALPGPELIQTWPRLCRM